MTQKTNTHARPRRTVGDGFENSKIIRLTLRYVFRDDLDCMRRMACMEYPYAEQIILGEQEATEQDVIMVEMASCKMQAILNMRIEKLRDHIAQF